MKITDWAIVFVLITAPLFWTSSIHAEQRRDVLMIEQRYNAALRTAAQDGGSRLNENELQQFEAGYSSNKYFRVDKEAGLSALLDTLYSNFGVADDLIGQRNLLNYIPAIAVVDYDGYYIYSARERVAVSKEIEISHQWTPKKPFAYTDSWGNIIKFTLDNEVTVYDASQRLWVTGKRDEIGDSTGIQLLKNEEEFNNQRTSFIVRSLEEDLSRAIAEHNQYASTQGINYTFTLPLIRGEDWANTIRDVGILVFLQGIPLGDQYYNNYALGGGRLIKRQVIYGGTDPSTGLRYYYRASCAEAYRTEETFANEREAASRGYFEAYCENGKE